jgi:hypothetical protein
MINISVTACSARHNFATGWACQALVKINELGPVTFSLLIPPSCYGRIENGIGRRFSEADLKNIFEAAIREHVLVYGPQSSDVHMPVLHELEVDVLISALHRAEYRRERNTSSVVSN